MSASLETLLTPEQRAECAKHDAAQAIQAATVRHDRMGIAARYLAGATHPDAADRIRYLEMSVLHLGRELETVTGLNAEPSPGTSISRLPMGMTTVPVEWSFHNGEVSIDAAFVNGQWTDPVPDGWCSSEQAERWCEALRREMNPERGRHIPEVA